jgi:hypothetical protein
MALKILITQIEHFTGARFTRRTWRANIADQATNEILSTCDHADGHRTPEAAIDCGRRLYRRSAKAVA